MTPASLCENQSHFVLAPQVQSVSEPETTAAEKKHTHLITMTGFTHAEVQSN